MALQPVESVDTALVEWTQANVPTEDLVIATLKEVRGRLADRQEQTGTELAKLRAEAKKVRSEIEKLGEALLATNERPKQVIKMLSERERRLTDIEGRIAAAEHAPSAIDLAPSTSVCNQGALASA